MQALESCITQVNSECDAIFSHTTRDSEGIRDRLNSAKVDKLSTLEVDMTRLKADLIQIDDFEKQAGEAKASARDIYQFLLNYRRLQEQANVLAQKQIKTDININLEDFPHETEDRLQKLDRYDSLCTMINQKDDMLSFLLGERDRFQRQERDHIRNIKKLDKATHAEVEQWIRLTDKFSGSLKEFHLICKYCGAPLNQRNVNSFCETNERSLSPLRNRGRSRSSVFGAPGSGLHFFVKRDDDDSIHDEQTSI